MNNIQRFNRVKVCNLGKEENVIKYRKPLNINIGVIVFVIIFIYVVFNVFMYFTESHVSPYEVEQGTMAANNIYEGLVIREESVYTSEHKGTVNYYVKEYSKVGFNDLIYSVDKNGSVASKLNEVKQNGTRIDNAISKDIVALLGDFHATYDSKDFYKVYALKDEMNSLLNEALSLDALNQISEYANTAEGNNTFHRVRAEEDGIVAYYTDGFEEVTVDMFEPSMLDEAAYQRNNLKAKVDVEAGDAVYKLIDSEKWHVILPISKELAAELRDDTWIRIRFLQDSKEMYAEYYIKEIDGANYMVLTMKNAMIRYASERYLEIELLLAEETGLKIPNSAIVEKEFYTIPVEYFLIDQNATINGIILERTDKDGKLTSEVFNPTVYYQTEEFCYVDSEFVQAGDIVIKQNSNDRYKVGTDTATLQGVYNINKGYAVFKQIEIIFQNEEYSIIKTGTSYGIALYDHIALDGSKIKEDELIK